MERKLYLVPELCHLTGLSEANIKNKKFMKMVAEKTRTSPRDKSIAIQKFINSVKGGTKYDCVTATYLCNFVYVYVQRVRSAWACFQCGGLSWKMLPWSWKEGLWTQSRSDLAGARRKSLYYLVKVLVIADFILLTLFPVK